MKKYKVQFIQKETFIVDVYAEDEQQAIDIAQDSFDNGDYQEDGDCHVEIDTTYDVTDTEDPFYPVN